jgi:hypothetical protein
MVVHRDAAAKLGPRRGRQSHPVEVMRVDPLAWLAALAFADGDARESRAYYRRGRMARPS